MNFRWRARAGQLALVVLLAATLGACSQAKLESYFVPSADLWAKWQAHDAASTTVIDHGDWDRVLKTYIREDGTGLNRFNYAAVTAPDKAALTAYIKRITALPISTYNRAEQFAFWVNLYNATTVALILENYPVESIRDITDGFLSPGPWDRKLLTIEGEQVSLNDIENRILRPIWNDPRIHYAVNCASVGCPNLRMQAYTGATVQSLLDTGARAYVNNPRGTRFHEGELIVSSIYIWFQEDFGGSETAVIDHIKSFASPALAKRLDRTDGIDGYAYDWALNEAK